MSQTETKALVELIRSLFTADELRRFVTLLPGEDLAVALPTGAVSLDALTFETIALLERHGRLDVVFFESLEKARPGRQEEIRAISALFLRSPESVASAGLHSTLEEASAAGSSFHPLAEKIRDVWARIQRLEAIGLSTDSLLAELRQIKREHRLGGQLRPGDLLDNRYLLIEQIGRGGFATVWKARDSANGDDVAIKVLHSELSGDIIRRQRFLRGARIMAELAHPHVVGIRAGGAEDDGFFYFVMDYVSGGDLHRAVVNSRIDSMSGLQMMLKVVGAVAAAHKRNYLHRDIKPANILITEDGEPLLTDFDLAAAADTTGGTRTGALGTFVYAAPEMLGRPHEADARADVYGLGMTIGFVLYGRDLPPEVMRDVNGFIDSVAGEPGLANVLKRAAAWDRNERFTSASSLLSALQGALRDIQLHPAAKAINKLEHGKEQLDAAEKQVNELQELWEKIQKKQSGGEAANGDPEREFLHNEYRRIQAELPRIGWWKPSGDSRVDMVHAGREIAEYRSRVGDMRREWRQKAVVRLINEIDELLVELRELVPPEEADSWSMPVSDKRWETFKHCWQRLVELTAEEASHIPEWGTMRRHVGFGQYVDLADIVRTDWPPIKNKLGRMFGSVDADIGFITTFGSLPAPSFDKRLSSRVFPVARAALEILVEVCQLSRWAQFIENIQISRDAHLGSYQYGAYGWPSSIVIRLKFRDSVEIPGIDSRQISGHTHHYNFGAGRRPGLYTPKQGGAKLCGATIRVGDDWFLDLPAMGQLMRKLYGSTLRVSELYVDGQGWPRSSMAVVTSTGQVPDYSLMEWRRIQPAERDWVTERWTARAAAELLWEPESRFLESAARLPAYREYVQRISEGMSKFVQNDREIRDGLIGNCVDERKDPRLLEKSMFAVHDACFSFWYQSWDSPGA